MTKFGKVSLFLLRVSLGWMFIYAGVTKIVNPAWTSAGYMKGAKTLSGLYGWLAGSSLLPAVDFLNEWGLTLVGIALLLGVFVRLASFGGAALMVLYYLPILDFPYPNAHAFIVDEHVVYFFAFLTLAAFRAGQVWGLERWCASLPICSRFPRLRSWLG